MDRQLLERLIGAGVLVVALVIVVPAILDGSNNGDDEGDVRDEPDRSAPVSEPRRTHTIRLNQPTQSPPVARTITPPAADSGQTAVKSTTAVSPNAEKVVVAKTQLVKKAAPPRVSTQSLPKAPSTPAPRTDNSVSASNTGWVVQLGSFSSQQNAQRLANEVGGHGVSVFLMSLNRSGKKLYRVRVGPLKTRAQATAMAERLKKLGYSGQVTQ